MLGAKIFGGRLGGVGQGCMLLDMCMLGMVLTW